MKERHVTGRGIHFPFSDVSYLFLKLGDCHFFFFFCAHPDKNQVIFVIYNGSSVEIREHAARI